MVEVSGSEAAIEVRLLGGFGVAVHGSPVAAATWPSRQAADLVKMLALARGRSMVRDQILDRLWPHLGAESAARALYKAASYARRALGVAGAIEVGGGVVTLGGGTTVAIDVVDFEAAAAHALASDRVASCTAAAARYTGDLLPEDRYADWADEPRTRLRSLYLELLRRAGAWEAIVSFEPTDEDAHRALMRHFADAGNRSAAVRQFRMLQEILARDLGVRPSPESMALYEDIARGPQVVARGESKASLIGRQLELAHARTILHRAADGRGGCILVTGDGGIGKTRFCEALLDEATQIGASSLRAGARGGEGLAYGPIVEALDQLLFQRRDLAASLTETARHVLVRLSSGIPGPAAGEQHAMSRQVVLSAVSQLLTVAAKERPVVLFVDDLQAANDSTIELLHFLASTTRQQPLVLLAAYRPCAHVALDAMRAALVGHKIGVEIGLGPLTRTDTSALVERVHGRAPDGDALAAVWRISEGSPFFVEELAARMDLDGGVTVPRELLDVVSARFTPMSPELVTLLERLAVAGFESTVEEIVALSELDEAAAFDRLDATLAEGVLVEQGGRYRFRHDLLREALLEAMPAHRREAAYRKTAAVLSRLGAAPARIARKLEAGRRPDEAASWWAEAAAQAMQVAAYASARQHIERALIRKRSPASLDLWAQSLFATGAAEAPAAFAEAAAAARGARRARLRIGQAEAHLAAGDVASARDALADLDARRPADRARLLTVSAQVAWFMGDADAAVGAARRARRVAGEKELTGTLHEAAVVDAMIAHLRGEWPDRARADFLDTARADHLAAAVSDAHLCAAEAFLAGAWPLERVAAFASALRDAAERSGARRGEAFASVLLGEVELLRGNLDDALPLLEDGVRRSLELGSLAGAALGRQRLAELWLHRDERARARSLLCDALDVVRASPLGRRHIMQSIYGMRALAAEDGVAEVCAAEVDIVGPAEQCVGCGIAFQVPAAVVCARGGDLERARSYAAAATHTAGLFWRGGAWYAALDEVHGEIAGAANESGAAHLLRAADGFDAAGRPLDANRCRTRAAEIDRL